MSGTREWENGLNFLKHSTIVSSLSKICLAIKGRQGLISKIRTACKDSDGIIWFHAASYGEFEEARPVIEATRRRYPEAKILLTFFSPSGYEHLKNWNVVDWVFYLPFDTPGNARRFLDAVRPAKAIFTLGEYWEFFLKGLRKRHIDTYIMSVRIRPDSPYMKWYGWRYRHIYRTTYKAVITQNETAADLVRKIGAPYVTNVGDARIDRVMSIAQMEWNDPIIDRWAAGEKVFVAGSTCPGGDDRLIVSMANSNPGDRFMIIPHEPDEAQIKDIEDSLKVSHVRYSEVKNGNAAAEEAKVMIVDKVGMLSKLYRYAFAAYVGAGFTTDCPHSVIEPAAYGLPVAVGPRFYQNPHFVELHRLGSGFSFGTEEDICRWYNRLKTDREFLQSTQKKSADYCRQNIGATERILEIIFGDQFSSR